MLTVRQTAHLSPADLERLSDLRVRAGNGASLSALMVAALSYYRTQVPLVPAALLGLEDQLRAEAATGRVKGTSFTVLVDEEREMEALIQMTPPSRRFAVPRRFSASVLHRLALLVLWNATDQALRRACRSVPPRPRRGPRPRASDAGAL